MSATVLAFERREAKPEPANEYADLVLAAMREAARLGEGLADLVAANPANIVLDLQSVELLIGRTLLFGWPLTLEHGEFCAAVGREACRNRLLHLRETEE